MYVYVYATTKDQKKNSAARMLVLMYDIYFKMINVEKGVLYSFINISAIFFIL